MKVIVDARILVLSVGAFAGSMESFVLPGLLPFISAELGTSMSQTGYIVFAYSLAYAIAGPLLASIFGSADRRKTLAAAELVFGVSALFAASAPFLALIAAGRVLLAGGAVLFTSLAQATAIGLSVPEFRGRAISVVVTGGTLAIAVGAPLGAWLAGQFGWRVIYGFVGIVALVAALVIWLRIPSRITAPALPLRARLAVLTLRGIPLALAMTWFYMVGSSMPTIYVATISKEIVGMPMSALPLIILANGLGAVCGGILGGQLVDRLGSYRTFLTDASAAVVVLALMSLLPVLPSAWLAPLWFVLTFLSGLLAWSLFASQVSLFAMLAPHSVPLAASLNLSAVSAGAAIAALVGGLIIDNIDAGALGAAGATSVLVALGLGVANRNLLRGVR